MNNFVLDKEQYEILKKIKQESGIPDDRFEKGMKFAFLVAEGKTRVEAYMEAFGESKEKARSNASNLFRAAWIQKLIKVFEVNEDIYYLPLKKAAIKKLEEIMLNSEDEKQVLDAAKTILKYTENIARIQKDCKVEEKEEKELDEGIELVKQLNERLKRLSQEGKVINSNKGVEERWVLK